MESKDYFKDSQFSDDDGNTWNVEDVLEFAQSNPGYLHKDFPLGKIEHDLKWWEDSPEQQERMQKADTSYPLLVLQEPDGTLSVADGLNRMKKAISVEGKKTIDVYLVPKEDIEGLTTKVAEAGSGLTDEPKELKPLNNPDYFPAVLELDATPGKIEVEGGHISGVFLNFKLETKGTENKEASKKFNKALRALLVTIDPAAEFLISDRRDAKFVGKSKPLPHTNFATQETLDLIVESFYPAISRSGNTFLMDLQNFNQLRWCYKQLRLSNWKNERDKLWQSLHGAVTAGMLDFPRKKLPDSIWLYEPEQPLPRLQPQLRATSLAEARYRLKKFGAKLKGVMLYGGAATYQYHEGGDIDVSLYIDWDDFKGDEEILNDAFKTVVIPWGKYELHLFIKPSNQQEQMEVADAYYDVIHDEWKLPPLVMPKGFDPDTFFEPMIEMAEKKAQKIDIMMGEVGREWMRLKKALRALKEGARDEHVVREKAEVTKGVLLDKVEVLCDTFVDIWKARKKLHDELRNQLVRDRTIGRFERFQFPEVCWKYLDEMGYVEFLKVLAKAQEAGVLKELLDQATPGG
jgi:hypothetical protein